MVESGYAEFLSSSWQGIFVPTGTPREAVDRLFAGLQQTLKTPEVVERLAQGGAYVATSASPKEFAGLRRLGDSALGQGRARESGATVD